MDEQRNKLQQDPSIAHQLQNLRQACGSGPVLILTHDNPDPDALATGKALATLLETAWNIPSRLKYCGLVLRAENRALLNLLTPEWQHADDLSDLDPYSAVALVDTQPGAGNNRFPEDKTPQIVIDHHHPLREKLEEVPFGVVRPQIGATATILAQYLQEAEVEIDPDLATALFYGIKTDTRGLSRGTSEADIDIYLKLLPIIDHDKLIKIEQAGLPQVYFCSISQGLQAAQVYERSIVAYLGYMHRPDLPAELADILIRLNNARAVLCLGIFEAGLYLSIRAEPLSQDAGLLVQQVIIPPGKAGGHGTMAGGQLPLDGHDENELVSRIIQRFLTIMGEKGNGQKLC